MGPSPPLPKDMKPRFRGHPKRGWVQIYQGRIMGGGYRFVTLDAAYADWYNSRNERGTRSPGKNYVTSAALQSAAAAVRNRRL